MIVDKHGKSTKKSPRIVVAGPCYQMLCDQRRADSVAMLYYALGKLGVPIGFPTHTHDTIVHHGRNRVMMHLLESNNDIALWMDSDTLWAPNKLEEVLIALWWMHEHPEIPVLAVCYLLRDRSPSISTFDKGIPERAEDLPQDFSEVCWAGTGFWITNLEWYRQNFAGPVWFDTRYHTRENPSEIMSEDVWHCKQLRKKGGKIILYPPEKLMGLHGPMGTA